MLSISKSKGKELVFILLLIAISSFLFAYKLDYDLPNIYNVDEAYVILPALRMGMGNFDPISYVYGPFFKYLLVLIYGAYYLVGLALLKFRSAEEFAVAFFRDPTPIFLLSRALSAAAGVLTVVLTYFLGRDMYNKKVGVTAALFLMVSPLFISFSHQAKMDMVLTLCFTLSFYFIYKYMTMRQMKYYIIAGIVLGLAVALKFPAVMLFVPFLYAHLSQKNSLFNKKLFLGIISIAFGYFIANPFALLNFSKVISQALFFKELYSYSMGDLPQPFSYWFYGMNEALGAIITWSGLAGFIYLILRRQNKDILLSLAVIAFFLSVGFSYFKSIHWLLPIFPLFLILSGNIIWDAAKKMFAEKGMPLIMAFIMGLFIFQPLRSSLMVLSDYNKLETRTLALCWIEKNVPKGSKILMDRGRYLSSFNVPLKRSKANLKNLLLQSRIRSGESDGYKFKKELTLEFPDLGKYYEYMMKALRENDVTYDVVPIFHGIIAEKGAPFVRDNLKSLTDYKREGIEYVVVSSICYLTYKKHVESEEAVPEFVKKYNKFYQDLDKDCKLMKVFYADGKKAKGPTIKIYHI